MSPPPSPPFACLYILTDSPLPLSGNAIIECFSLFNLKIC